MSEQIELPLPGTLPPESQAAIEAWLIGEGLPYVVAHDEGRYDTKVILESDGDPCELHFHAFENDSRIYIRDMIGVRAGDGRTVELMRYLNWLNWHVQLTTWGLGPHRDVEVRVGAHRDLGARPDLQLVERMVSLLWNARRSFKPILTEIAQGRCSAAEAIGLAEDRR